MNLQFGLALPAGVYSPGLTYQQTLAGLLGGGTFWNPITVISWPGPGFPLNSANYSLKNSFGKNTACSLATFNFGQYYPAGWAGSPTFVSSAFNLYKAFGYTDYPNPRLTFTNFTPGKYDIIIYNNHGNSGFSIKNRYSIYNAANTLLSSVQYNNANIGSVPTSIASLVENTHYLRISNITLPQSFYILLTNTSVQNQVDKPMLNGISFKKL